jgi:HPt (histidine-containing phosphotransfer) domain-containing protein
MRLLVDDFARGDSSAAVALTEVVHRLRGVAGTIGFPTVSARASDLEHLVTAAEPVDAVRARSMVDAVENALAADLAKPEA